MIWEKMAWMSFLVLSDWPFERTIFWVKKHLPCTVVTASLIRFPLRPGSAGFPRLWSLHISWQNSWALNWKPKGNINPLKNSYKTSWTCLSKYVWIIIIIIIITIITIIIMVTYYFFAIRFVLSKYSEYPKFSPNSSLNVSPWFAAGCTTPGCWKEVGTVGQRDWCPGAERYKKTLGYMGKQGENDLDICKPCRCLVEEHKFSKYWRLVIWVLIKSRLNQHG